MSWFLYVLECRDGSLYTGITNNVEARCAAHAAGTGARYTRSHPPARLLLTLPYPDRSASSKAEYALKQLSARQKHAYVRDCLALQAIAARAAEPQEAAAGETAGAVGKEIAKRTTRKTPAQPRAARKAAAKAPGKQAVAKGAKVRPAVAKRTVPKQAVAKAAMVKPAAAKRATAKRTMAKRTAVKTAVISAAVTKKPKKPARKQAAVPRTNAAARKATATA